MDDLHTRLDLLQSVLDRHTFWPGTVTRLQLPVDEQVVLFIVTVYMPDVERVKTIDDMMSFSRWTTIFRTWSMHRTEFMGHSPAVIIETFKHQLEWMTKDIFDHEWAEWFRYKGQPVREPVHEPR